MKKPSSTASSSSSFLIELDYDAIDKKNIQKDIYEFGEIKEDKRKKKTKQKKLNEKEILNMDEKSGMGFSYNDNSIISQRKYYENIHYLSPREKDIFEQKFTKPKNESQTQYTKLLQYKSNKIVIATGPAGTGKTLFATEYGIRNFLIGKYKKLVFTRPSVSVDEELGFLPGTLEEKMAPWIRPIYDILYQFIHPKEVADLIEEKVIEIAPLGFMRGRTFMNCWIVADEMQNSTTSQMKMLMTRLGENSRIIITGDLDQHDRIGGQNGLEDFLEKFRGKRSPSISSFEFHNSDIQREEVVREVLEIYSGNAPPTDFLDDGLQENENEK